MQQGILSGDGRSNVTWKQGSKRSGALERMIGVGKVTAAKLTLTSFTIDAAYCPDCKKMIFDTDISN